MLFYHKGLRVRKIPFPFVACARKATILRGQIWSVHESDVVGLEGSRQEAIPLPSTTFNIFSVAFHLAHSAPDWRCQTHPCFHSRGVGSVRRTSHPSGSRPRDISLLRQTSAPGIFHAPENPRFPAVSKRVQRTDRMAPIRVQLSQGSRQRRRTTRPCGGRPSVKG